MTQSNFEQICFVVMPFGRRTVGRVRHRFLPWSSARTVDFDRIYDHVFDPAIAQVALPEGGTLVPRRADRDFYSGIISEDMFAYLEYSRLVLADISSINANVYYELGVRHRAREAGTIVLRQTDAAIPFDINQVRAFPYEYQPEAQAGASRALISRVLSESLQQLRVDSPVQLALKHQLVESRRHPGLEDLLRAAEDDVRAKDRAAAINKLTMAIRDFDAGPLVRHKLALMHRDQSEWIEVIAHENRVISQLPTFSDAFRERGIAENKLYERAKGAGAELAAFPNGEASLRRAVSISPTDYDARSCLGGVLKRAGRFEEAFQAYRDATNVSHGHPYPLLNEIKTQAGAGLAVVLDDLRRQQLERARRMRRAQTEDRPPLDTPWSYFDLGEIALYLNDLHECREATKQGMQCATDAWQVRTHRQSLELLRSATFLSDDQRAAVAELVAALAKTESSYTP